jgi:hypothetical protein
MPRRKSLTKRILQHLLLLSLARAILTVSGRGRAWDEWDEQRYEDPQPAAKRSFQRRFAQTLSFSALFFAGLAISAGAGNTVRALLDDESATSQAQTGATGTTGATGRRPSRPHRPRSPSRPLRRALSAPLSSRHA